MLPPGLDLHSPAAATQVAKGTTTEVQWGLSLASVFAVVLAFIIIVNTFLMNISERRGQIAILRAVGAMRRQVVPRLPPRGVGDGTARVALLGCGLGLPGGYLLTKLFMRLNVSEPPPVVLSPWPFVLAIVLRLALLVLAAASPAWLTTRVEPLEAMRPDIGHVRNRGELPVSPRSGCPSGGTVLLLTTGGLLAASVVGLAAAGALPSSPGAFAVVLVPCW